MKKVFTDPGVPACDMIRSVLEGHGIRAVLKNEHGSATVGGDPVPFMPALAFAWPEVWVADEAWEQAIAIVDEAIQAGPPSLAPWACPRCGETVDSELAVCWNCETPKPD